MAPVLLLLATHVALALNSNRYNPTESSIINKEPVKHLQYSNNNKPINDISQETIRSTSSPVLEHNSEAPPILLEETTEGGETEFTTAQTYNKYIDLGTTAVNLINFTQTYEGENTETTAVELNYSGNIITSENTPQKFKSLKNASTTPPSLFSKLIKTLNPKKVKFRNSTTSLTPANVHHDAGDNGNVEKINNNSSFPKLIGIELPFKPMMAKRSHQHLATNQSTNDNAIILQSNFFHATDPPQILNYNTLGVTEISHHNVEASYTEKSTITRTTFANPINPLPKSPKGQNNKDAVTLPPTSPPSSPDKPERNFPVALKTTESKSILHATRESITESQTTSNENTVNLNFRNILSTTVSVGKKLVQVDTGSNEDTLKIYDPIYPCTECPNATATTISTSDSEGRKFEVGIQVPDLPLRHDASVKNPTALDSREGFMPAKARQDKAVMIPVHVGVVTEGSAGGSLTTSASDDLNDVGDNDTLTVNMSTNSVKVISEFPWPVKKEAVVEGDLVLGGLMMVHEREDTVTCGPVMPQGGIQALEAMLYTLDRLNEAPTSLLPNITLGAHILDDCDKDTYGLEMAVDFIKA